MIQSLVRKDSVANLVAGYGQVIVDECHHLPAVQFERVLREAKARYIVGLTATPQRRDERDPITEMQLGPVRFKVDAKAQAALERETSATPNTGSAIDCTSVQIPGMFAVMNLEARVLLGTYELTCLGPTTEVQIASSLGARCVDVRAALAHLELRGLVVVERDDRTRLTLAGLALAVATSGAPASRVGRRPSPASSAALRRRRMHSTSSPEPIACIEHA
jgi:Type III restriction enzyme, res subunit